MKHYLITQWNCDLYDLEWLKKRQKLFEHFTIPSVMSQTNKNFEWILVSDTRTPDEFKKILNNYPATILYHDFENFEWENAPVEDMSDPIMKRSVQLEYISSVISDFIGKQGTDYIITSRCDNDDAIAVNHIDKIQVSADKYWNNKEFTDRFWVNIVRGFKWDRGMVYPKSTNKSPFISFVEPDNGDLLTTYQCCHTLAPKSKFEVVNIREGHPTWMQVIHDDNLLNKVMRFKGGQSEDTIRDRFIYGNKRFKD